MPYCRRDEAVIASSVVLVVAIMATIATTSALRDPIAAPITSASGCSEAASATGPRTLTAATATATYNTVEIANAASNARGTVRAGFVVSSASVMTSSNPTKAKNTRAAAPTTPATEASSTRFWFPRSGMPITTIASRPPTCTVLSTIVNRADCSIPTNATAVTTPSSSQAPSRWGTSKKYPR